MTYILRSNGINNGGEEKMIEKAETTWGKHKPNSHHILVCLSYHENPKGFQGHFFSVLITMGVFPFCFTVNSIVVFKLFYVFCRFVFDPGAQSPRTLIIRDGLFQESNLIF